MFHVTAYLGVTILSRTIERMTSLFLFLRGRDLCSNQGSSRRFLSPKSQFVNDNVHLWHIILFVENVLSHDRTMRIKVVKLFALIKRIQRLSSLCSVSPSSWPLDILTKEFDRLIKPRIDQQISVKQLTSFVGETKDSHRPRDTKMMRRESIFLSETVPAKWLHFQLCQNSCY